MKRILCTLGSLFLTSVSVVAQGDFYDLNQIQKIEIFFSTPNWDYQMDTSKLGMDGYVFADSIRINGVTMDSVGVKYKGNSSYDSTYVKNPLHLSLDEFKSHTYQGFKDVKLGNGFDDPSQIREVLSYSLLANYMDCPRSNFAQVYINSNYLGVYSNVESVNKAFCSEHFGSSSNTFIKCNPLLNPSPSTKSNLKFLGSDSTSYFNFYEIKSDFGWTNLVNLCDSILNHPETIENMLDLDRVIWMLAFDNVLVNLDSYMGVFSQNYYLYRDGTKRYVPIVWDLNMSFGGFPYIGNAGSSMGTLTVANMQQLSPTIHATDLYWPLINRIQENPQYKRMYMAHIRTMVQEIISANSYLNLAQSFQALIDTAVQSETTGFYSYADFQGGLTQNVTNGNYSIPGIATLMNGRLSYFQTNSEFNLIPPVIASVNPSNLSPNLNSNIQILVSVSGATSVFLGLRNSSLERFIRYPMYDDGISDDGIAGNGIYGISITIQSLTPQYYVYAENNDAGIFSPARAEHEFYTIQATTGGESGIRLVINELMASNSSTATDEAGEFDDWIELYNLSSEPIDLSGFYLSDDSLSLTKWTFPDGSIIPGNGYYIVWADEDQTQGVNHSNFKLSATSESLTLSDTALHLIDAVVWGVQTSDISFARIPNGTGDFAITQPTFNAPNDDSGVDELGSSSLRIYPNPAKEELVVVFENQGLQELTIRNLLGIAVLETRVSSGQSLLLTGLNPGVYFLNLGGEIRKLVKE
ncbi:MAG: CotH kinase family protein [Bacteroidia bacterium]|nr:CotH kinase family protein [Bacteroidia bacterium]